MSTDFAPKYNVPIGGGHFRASGPTGADNGQGGGWITISPNVITMRQTFNMDVARWEIEQVFENKPLICGGLFGATDARLVGYHYMFRAIIVRDINCPPDFRLRGIPGCTLYFILGDVSEGVSDNSNSSADIPIHYYWSPDCTIDNSTPILDANGKRTARDLVVGRFRSHVFLIPEEGVETDSGTLAGAYAAWYRIR